MTQAVGLPPLNWPKPLGTAHSMDPILHAPPTQLTQAVGLRPSIRPIHRSPPTQWTPTVGLRRRMRPKPSGSALDIIENRRAVPTYDRSCSAFPTNGWSRRPSRTKLFQSVGLCAPITVFVALRPGIRPKRRALAPHAWSRRALRTHDWIHRCSALTIYENHPAPPLQST